MCFGSTQGKRQKIAQLCKGIMKNNDFNLKFQQSTKGGDAGEFSKQSFLVSENKSITKLNKNIHPQNIWTIPRQGLGNSEVCKLCSV